MKSDYNQKHWKYSCYDPSHSGSLSHAENSNPEYSNENKKSAMSQFQYMYISNSAKKIACLHLW